MDEERTPDGVGRMPAWKIVQLVAWRNGLIALTSDGRVLFGTSPSGLLVDIRWTYVPIPNSTEMNA
ncbi:MAG TPA: hypothetical protein DCP69_02305 [Candidatus Omnitrophica bacterium]|nr:hypothetical protein [Candidatus Omnitrophota bacterium]